MARDANYWPFDTYSIWNLPIGTGVQYEATSQTKSNQLRTYPCYTWFSTDPYGVPVYIATNSDPVWTVTDSGQGGATFQMRLPDDVLPVGGTDSNVCVIQPDGVCIDMWVFQITGTHTANSAYVQYNHITGSGIGPHGGIRAASFSTLGGLIRKWEVDPTDPNYTDGVIRHSLVVNLPYEMFKSGWIWPATSEDSTAYLYSGQIPMGQMFAIPKSVNVSGLGLSSAGLKVATALQTYGGYVGDTSGYVAQGGAVCFYGEATLAGNAFTNALFGDLATIRSNLVCITNSTQATPAGGGTYTPLAPQIGTGGTPPPSTRPDETNTGYLPTGETLTAYSGPMTITTATTITKKSITGGLVIDGVDVTIEKSKITLGTSDQRGVYCINGGTLTINDVEVDGAASTITNSTGIDGWGITATRVNVHGCVNGVVTGTNSVLQNSYIHGLKSNGGGAYPDCVAHWGGISSVTIRDNTLQADHPDAAAALFLAAYWGDISNVTISGNYISGGLSNAYLGTWRTGDTAGYLTDIRVTDNTWACDNSDYVANGNSPVYAIDGHTTITGWTDNVDLDDVAVTQPANTSGGGTGGGGGGDTGGGTTLQTGVASVASGAAVIRLDSSTALTTSAAHTTMVWYKTPDTTSWGWHGVLGAMQDGDGWETGTGYGASDGWGVHTYYAKLWNFYHNSGTYGDEPAPSTVDLLTVGEWVHLAFVVTPSAGSMTNAVYVNGSYIQTISDTGPTIPTTGMVPLLGSIDGSDPAANGSFACWKVWNAALSGAEIATEMNSLTAVKSGAIIDVDFIAGNAPNRGSGGTWSQALGSWSFGTEGIIPSTDDGGTTTTFIYTDNFNRALTDTTLGTPWTVSGGTWGVASGTGAASGVAYCVSGDPAYAVVDTDSYTHSISARIFNGEDGCQGIVLRYVDSDNYVVIDASTTAGTWVVSKVLNGTEYLVGDMGSAGIFSGRVGGSVAGTVFTFTVDTITKNFTITDAVLQTGTKCGLRWGDTTPPTIPGSVTVTALTSTSMQVTWTASTSTIGLAGYRIYRSGVTAALGTVDSNTLTWTHLSGDPSYGYAVAAYDTGGNQSPLSGYVVSTGYQPPADTTAPTVPAGVTATALTSASVQVQWTASTDAVGVARYYVYRDGSNTALGSSTGTSYVDTTCAPSTGYTYKVAAADIAGNISAKSTQASATTPAVTVGTRNPFLQPFDASSPWNTCIGSGAVYESASAPITSTLANAQFNAWLNVDSFSEPLYQASESDPIRTIWDWNADWGGRPWNSRTIHVPEAATPAVGTDHNMGIFSPDQTEIVEAWSVYQWTGGAGPVGVQAGDWISWRVTSALTHGSGWGPSPSTAAAVNGTWAYGGGIRGCGSSTPGGLIRRWEVDPSDPNYTDGVIRHALAMALDGAQMYYNGVHDPNWVLYDYAGYGLLGGYVWPATEEDAHAASGYFGNIPMGSLFAIPKSVDITQIGLTTPAGLTLAKACQDYGAYISDVTSYTDSFYAEPSLAGSAFVDQLLGAPNWNAPDLWTIRRNLRRITNNTSTSVGGGGSRPIAPLPPLA